MYDYIRERVKLEQCQNTEKYLKISQALAFLYCKLGDCVLIPHTAHPGQIFFNDWLNTHSPFENSFRNEGYFMVEVEAL